MIESTGSEKMGQESTTNGTRADLSPQPGSRISAKSAGLARAGRAENMWPRGRWRRERNWDPTFSEFAGPNSPEGKELGSNRCVEKTAQFDRRKLAFHSLEREQLPTNIFG
jgi:hypothetical protein